MMCFYKYSLILLAALSLIACEDEGEQLHVQDVEVPDGYALSAGISTEFSRSAYSYDEASDWVRGRYETLFNEGDRLYDNVASSNYNGEGGGRGPVFVGYCCGSCHRNAGRTQPSYWMAFKNGSDKATGEYGFTSMLCYITKKNGAFFPNYGRVIHDNTIYGVTPEGELHFDIDSATYQFPDGEKYTLCYPKYRITKWYADSIKPEDLFISVRVPLRHVGQGVIMALDREEIRQLAAKSNYPEWGISGRYNIISERGVSQIGVGGNKSHHADLTVELGYSSDMGMTNSRFPEEICRGQKQIREGAMMGMAYHKLDVSTKDMEAVDLYLHSLAVPARRDVNNPDVKEGEKLFYKAGCHLCHVTTLHTNKRGVTLLGGMSLPWLGGHQAVHPYSDFLLHDMGSEIMGVGLNDHMVSGLARGNEWRTTPLWGIGLQLLVNGHTYFLHDGRARNFTEAIMWHGGEAQASKQKFAHFSKQDRAKLIRFLWSL